MEQPHLRPQLALLTICVTLTACAPRVFESSMIEVLPSSPPVEEVEEQARVEVADDKIVIHEKIQFDYNKATIRPESHGLLAEIAQVIADNPGLRSIRVEGHASSEGPYAHNVSLSRRRAKAVRDHLVERGHVDPARLESDGYGPDRPIAPNNTATGREANRRVEFTILVRESVEEAD